MILKDELTRITKARDAEIKTSSLLEHIVRRGHEREERLAESLKTFAVPTLETKNIVYRFIDRTS